MSIWSMVLKGAFKPRRTAAVSAAGGRTVVLALVSAAVLGLSACAQSLAPPLPDVTKSTADSMMTPAQQQKAIADLAAKKAAEETEALDKIKGSR